MSLPRRRLPRLLLLLLCFPRRPHRLLILALVRARQVSNRVLQETLVRALPLQGPPHERSHAVILRAILQLLCVCNNERCKTPRSCWAHRTLLLLRRCHVVCFSTRAVCGVPYTAQ
jgi:hypothetical protein